MRNTTISDVEPLTSKTKAGVPYERQPAVEAECRAVLMLPESEWLRERKKYRPETLVHLIRKTLLGDSEVHRVLAAELNKRIVRIARKAARGWDQLAAEEIIGKVQFQILKVVFATNPSRRTEFLEVSFFGAVADYTRNAAEAYEKTIDGNRGYIFEDAVDEDGEQIERPMELLLSDYAGPEESIIALRNQELVQRLIATATTCAKDPRCVEAVVLHVLEDMKVASDDPGEDTLARRYGGTLGQLKHMLNCGRRALRQAYEELGAKQ